MTGVPLCLHPNLQLFEFPVVSSLDWWNWGRASTFVHLPFRGLSRVRGLGSECGDDSRNGWLALCHHGFVTRCEPVSG